MSDGRSPYVATGAIRPRWSATAGETPGQRLHAALLANGMVPDGWETYHPLMQEDFEAAAREYEGGRAHDPEPALCWRVERSDAPDPAFVVTARSGSIRMPLDAGLARDLIDELAPHAAPPATIDGCLADAANADDARDRLDALTTEVAALRRDRDNDDAAFAEVGDRLTEVEADLTALEPTISDIYRRLAALEARAIDGGDPLRRTA